MTRFPLHTLALGLALASGTSLAALSTQQMSQAKAEIASTYQVDKTACSRDKGNVKDVCLKEAQGKERVALAELEHRHSGSADDARKHEVAKVETRYAVAREKCDDWTGNAKDVCVQEAKTAEAKSLADLKMVKAIGEARNDANQTKHDAKVKLATEKCEALAGDAKTQCMSTAKTGQ